MDSLQQSLDARYWQPDFTRKLSRLIYAIHFASRDGSEYEALCKIPHTKIANFFDPKVVSVSARGDCTLVAINPSDFQKQASNLFNLLINCFRSIKCAADQLKRKAPSSLVLTELNSELKSLPIAPKDTVSALDSGYLQAVTVRDLSRAAAGLLKLTKILKHVAEAFSGSFSKLESQFPDIQYLMSALGLSKKAA